MKSKILSWVRNRDNLILLAILFLAALLRLYRISDYMTFLGDEGRDVLTVKHILEGDLTLLGPRSSAADFFYGPIYFYLITPFLWLFRYDPVGPAVFIALLGIITVYLVYVVGKTWMGVRAGLIAAALYTVSPIVIAYSRSSWNPNPLPFVSLLMLFLLYKGLKKPRWWIFGVVGVLLGIALQLQYLALFLGLIVAVITGIGTIFQKKAIVITLAKRYFLIFIGFLTGFSPFLGFEILHGFPNTKTIFNFLLGKYESGDGPKMDFFGQVSEMFLMIFGRLITRFPEPSTVHVNENSQLMLWYIVTILFGLLAVLSILKIKDRYVKLVLFVWLVVGVGMFGFYKKELYDYYMGFMFPLPFLLVANLIRLPFEGTKRRIVKVGASILFIILFAINLAGMPFRYEPNRQKEQVKTIAKFVLSKTDNKPFNFALITPGNSDHGYRYYFEVYNRKPVTIENSVVDPERKTVTDQLLIVCEDVDCNPLGHPLFEVAAFGRGEIVGEWDVSVVKVYKLIPYKGEE